ncbi:hypothetical protein [Deinococcus multiflagellatus]|uniref:Uncharacterized protein n=1 Tax=Deinococcus multiflagellatus TaxID=1656887 RepID=A0ABW1ZTK7_9DEIO|nr:hypothetical protein [Deinococcus multiflagellatus]MBZ9714462.1 hypothetical protein [Deinococcus multiflagellatus]
MKRLTKDQTKSLLTSALQRNGVSPSAIQTAVDGFMLDLAQGRSLKFGDLGTLEAQGEQVTLTPPETVKVTLTPTAKIAKQPAGWFRQERSGVVRSTPAGMTITDEAATRHFERNGYPRREAERAVHIGRTRKRVD